MASTNVRGAVASCIACGERIGQVAVTATRPEYFSALRVSAKPAPCPRCGGAVQWAVADANPPDRLVVEAMQGPRVPRVVGRRVTPENMR